MPDSQQIRKQLYDARIKKAETSQLLFEVREYIKRLEADNERLNRAFDPENNAHTELRTQIEQQLEEARKAEKTLAERYQGSVSLEKAVFKTFATFSNPSENISQMNDEFPFLLLPLRIETRFRLDLDEFWVRVYPDDCAVDSFEPTLSETEVKNAQVFWSRMWAAGGNEDQERATWRGLVSSHGSGRARWIIHNYRPLNAGVEPTKQNSSDVILVISTEQKFTQEELQPLASYWNAVSLANKDDAATAINALGAERAATLKQTYPLLNPEIAIALAAYWKAIWLADGKQSEEITALNTFKGVVGENRAIELIEAYPPFNSSEKPSGNKKKNEVNSSVAFIVFPTADQQATKRHSWSQPARVNIMPDCLVLLGFKEGKEVLKKVGNPIPSPLIVTPDPAGSPGGELKADKGDLSAGDDIRWMVDFNRAIEWGLGFKVKSSDLINAQLKDGFDRLLVLGVRLSADEQGGKELLQTLLLDHQNSSKGLSLLLQGTPTNNTETGGAAFSRSQDADDTFELYVKGKFKGQPPVPISGDWSQESDGQWLAECLGIDRTIGMEALHGNSTDQFEARAMNRALFPGTLGYMLHTMLGPVLDSETIRKVGSFFTHYVSGRGTVPAIRIGNQPYGILPTTTFSHISWFSTADSPGISVASTSGDMLSLLANIYQRVRVAHSWWEQMAKGWNETAKGVDYIGKQGDPHTILLNILGLHSSSVEYHSRNAQSEDHLYNLLNLLGIGGDFFNVLLEVLNNKELEDALTTFMILRQLGYQGEEIPDLLKLVSWADAQLLKGPVIDDRPLSETEGIRAYTDDKRNYLKWLADSVQSLDILRTQAGFKDDKPPKALLYIVMRYALMNAFWETGIRFQLDANLLSSETAEALRKESPFIHISQIAQSSESRWANLYADYKEPGTDATITVEQAISKMLHDVRTPPLTHVVPIPNWLVDLMAQLRAIELLEKVPTARLERLFAEHIDCCSYRLDAWELGLVNYQLAELRSRHYSDQVEQKGGVHLGAYGWLENVRLEDKTLASVQLPEDLDDIFNPTPQGDDPSLPPLLRDSSNGGYIHAPSLNHAVTAAVLRNGYLVNATELNPQTLAVNLSSERVRLALSFIEGIRNGQNLGALLGYQLERGLHDRHNLVNNIEDELTLDGFIFELRKAFPLSANHLKLPVESSDNAPDVTSASIEVQEARNVVDGQSLIEEAKKPGNRTYPFGKSLPSDATQAQKDAINAEVDRLLDIHDALADLALAESVHQVVQGNYDRAAATVDAYGKSSFPPIPDVIQTPRSGITLTHRVGLQLETGLDPSSSPVTGIGMTPRAKGEPALNKWLTSLFPDAADLVCNVVYKDPLTGNRTERKVSWKDLQLQPIDLLYLVRPENEQAMTELDDRIVRHVLTNSPPRSDVQIEIRYTDTVDGKITFFELAPLVQRLRALVLASRPLNASDVMLHNEASQVQEELVYVDRSRITNNKNTGLQDTLKNLLDDPSSTQDDLTTFITELDAVLKDVANLHDNLIESTNKNIDKFIIRIVELLEQASSFGIPQTGWGFAYAWKAQQFTKIFEQIKALVKRWDDRLKNFDALIDQYDHPTGTLTNEEKYTLLQRAELEISTQLTTISSSITPSDLQKLHAALTNKRKTFDDRRKDFADLLKTTTVSLATLLDDFDKLLLVSSLDAVTTEIDEIKKIEQVIITFAGDLLRIAQGVAKEADTRIKNAQKKIDQHDAAASASIRAKALQEAASALLGDDFHLIPEFILTLEQGNEWVKALGGSGDLLKYLKDTVEVDFPVDDWLYGAARVREKLHHWERVVMLAGAVGGTEPELTPIQFPFKTGDSWVALEFPQDESFSIEGDRLLYTAHYALDSKSFDKTKKQCGLLLDEWTEVLPRREKIEDIAFKLDQPQQEEKKWIETETTGIAFNFDQPSTEPPQVMLLVMPPKFTGKWVWQDLVDALNETLDLAKIRAVDPAQVDETPLNRLLPATIMAYTLREISISANLASNIGVMEKLNARDS